MLVGAAIKYHLVPFKIIMITVFPSSEPAGYICLAYQNSKLYLRVTSIN